MSALAFEVVDAHVEPYAAAPTLGLRLRIVETTGAVVHALVLRCQIRIEPQRRNYDEREGERLASVFGERSQWSDSLKPFLWTHVGAAVPGFAGETEITLEVPCTYDMEVAGTTYLNALDDGDVPLILLFSGTLFTKGTSGVEAELVAWDQEASFRLPVQAWRDTMDRFFPNCGWLRVHRDIFESLERFKSSRGLPTWDLAMERLLKEAGEE